ncbi:PhoH family protein [Arcticibacterium luteifluviistationis]|uniref:PhoH-like protein n=1 Tax=Arcticibacterium luteifluviistationis TaxID=1784714 RepID=A0A2Z4G6W4_9BACT|nr:PhoH family protein [Arcticibacterium luteifluviistationis]AWV96888.1 phosphate starvation-inducible protein PhoH [Arcticibacterium luteifluviistationis]
MTEIIIELEGVSLIDFLGVQNKNIKEVAKFFPTCKIISRGNEIHLKGPSKEVTKLESFVNDLQAHYQKYGTLSPDVVKNYLENEKEIKESLSLPDDVIVHGNKGLVVKAKTTNQKKLVQASYKHDIVFAVGPAGTGKTYTAVALAVKALKEKQIKKIIITRPAVEAGENLGFLPGDLKEKIDPYLMPIYDALNDMLHAEKMKDYVERKVIEIAPLAYMRGRTLNDAFIILDEAQNTTTMQLKMFLTRMGPKSKIVITGDITQIDLPPRQKSGLADAIQKLNKIKGIKFIELDGRDVVRHPLVVDILKAYDEADK